MLCLLTMQWSWADGVIRLKTRSIHHGGGPDSAIRRGYGKHVILQFGSYPGPEVREELARRGIRVLEYVPDSALMVSAGKALDLEGLDVTWAGTLDAADKISPSPAMDTAAAYLVVFYADADLGQARALVEQRGYLVLEHPGLLPAQLLVTGTRDRLEQLAGLDEVSYILPASTDLVAGDPVIGCVGALTEAGPVGEYVQVGNGWSKDAAGGVSLQYFFDSLTARLYENATRGEIERAFQEWAHYANISFLAGSGQAAARSIDIRFATGVHGDGYPFTTGVLAHTFYPSPPNAEPLAGDIHFNDDVNWQVGTNVDLFSVALHEAGHALGLGHSDNPGAVMYPYYRLSTGLAADDIAGIQALYGAIDTTPPSSGGTSPPSLPPPQTPASPAPTSPTTPTSPTSPTPPQTPAANDPTPPSLTIVVPGSTIVSTSAASASFSGRASDNVGVAAVTWSTSTGSSGTASGTANWSANVPLLVGTNVVTIRAYDADGNSAWRAVAVVRR
jgi:hypothetical protein